MARILVVDDNLHVGKVFARALERAGYSVETVASGSAALRRVGEECFDLIVLDLSMPELDGFEVLRALRDAQPAPPPVVMISGAMGDALLQAAEFLGAVASLPKSAGIRGLVETVERILRPAAPC